MILNKENTFTEQNRFLVYSDQLNATRKQILDTAEEMISRSAIQTFEDEGETITATDASYLAGLTVDGKAVQDGTPTPSAPVDVQVVKSINLWDEEWESGSINSGTGANENNAAEIRSKNYIPIEPETYYYFMCGAPVSGNIKSRFYDADKNYIGYKNYFDGNVNYNAEFKSPTGARYMRFAHQSSYGTTYKNDTCINVSNSAINGLYISHNAIGLKVGSTVTPIDLQGEVLAGFSGIKDVLSIDSVGHKLKDKRIGVVDLGALTWTMQSSGVSGKYRAKSYITDIKMAASSGVVPNVICSQFAAITENAAWNMANGVSVASNEHAIYCCDDNYSSSDSAAAFKTAMSGVLLYYELTTAETIDLGYIDMPAIPDGSTISITAQVTPTIAAKWWTKNQSDVAAAFGAVSSDLAALQDEISALDARVTALEGSTAKSLVLEKLESAKEPLEEIEPEEAEEQEEMNLDE